jgi:hypothetical protein
MINLFEKALTAVQTESPNISLDTQMILAMFRAVSGHPHNVGFYLSVLKLYKHRPDIERAMDESVCLSKKAITEDLRHKAFINAMDAQVKPVFAKLGLKW